MPLTDNLISYWKLDEASGNALDAHSTNDLTDNASVGAGTGKIAGARDFESTSSQFFSRADNAALSMGDIDFSIQAWVKLESKGANRIAVSKWGDTTAAQEYVLYFDAGTDRFIFAVWTSGGSFGSAFADNLGSPSLATWYLLHAWHDSVNNLLGISVNAGTANTISWTTGVQDTTAGFKIGALGAAGSDYFDGLIDEVGVWKRVLTSGDRTSLYNSGSGLAYPFAALVAGTVTRNHYTTSEIKLTSAAPTGGSSPYTYQWHRSTDRYFTPGGGTALSGKTALVLTDTTATAGQMYWYKLISTDSAGSPASVTTAVAVSGQLAQRDPVMLLCIGTSLTTRTPSGGQSPATWLGEMLGYVAGLRMVTSVDQGVAGSDSGNWLSGSANLNAAISAGDAAAASMPAGTAKWAHIEHGYNDASASHSSGTFLTNMTSMTGALIAAGYKCILSYPSYDNSSTYTTTQLDTFNAASRGYFTVIDGLVNGTTIRRGATIPYAITALDADVLMVDDSGASWNADGAQFVATAYAGAIAAAIDPATSSRRIGRIGL